MDLAVETIFVGWPAWKDQFKIFFSKEPHIAENESFIPVPIFIYGPTHSALA